MLKNYKVLKVWQKSNQYIKKTFPQNEDFDLTFQMRREVLFIPSNISEGYGRKTTPEYIQALYIAYGSNCELETQSLLAGDLGYIPMKELNNIQNSLSEVERMLKALIKTLERKNKLK